MDRVPLEDAIKRLSDNIAVFYTQDPKEQNYKITKIAVRLKGGETPGGLALANNTMAILPRQSGSTSNTRDGLGICCAVAGL